MNAMEKGVFGAVEVGDVAAVGNLEPEQLR